MSLFPNLNDFPEEISRIDNFFKNSFETGICIKFSDYLSKSTLEHYFQNNHLININTNNIDDLINAGYSKRNMVLDLSKNDSISRDEEWNLKKFLDEISTQQKKIAIITSKYFNVNLIDLRSRMSSFEQIILQ